MLFRSECESVPYKAFDSLVDALSHYLLRRSSLEVEALLPRDTESLLCVFPVLRRVEAFADARTRGQCPLDKQERRERAFAALRELLGRLGDRLTLILHIDDLQWSDSDSTKLLGDLLKPPDAPTLLLLACHRIQDDKELQAPLHFPATGMASTTIDLRHVVLEPLSFDESRQLAAEFWEPPQHPPDLWLDSIASNADGNPFFVESLARYYRNATSTHSMCQLAGPPSLEQVLWEQVASLDPSAQKLLQVVAVAGHPVRYLDACRAASLIGDASEACAALRAGRLIRVPGTSASPFLETYHDRVRHTVVSRLRPEQLHDLHRRLAEAMETAGESDPATLAAHFVAADESRKGRACFLEAANQASDALAFERAAELYRQACEISGASKEQQRLLMRKRAAALANAGRGADAGQAYIEAAAESPKSESLELQRLAAMQFLFSGDVDKGLTIVKAVLADIGMRLPKGPRRALLQWLGWRANLRTRGLKFQVTEEAAVAPQLLKQIDVCWSVTVGLSIIDPISAAVFQTRGLLLALRSGEPGRIARALCVEAAHVSVLGGPRRKQVDSLLERAETIACRLGDPHIRGLVQLATGVSALNQGRWKAAWQSCDKAETTFREHCTGVAWEMDCAAGGAATALFDAGEVAELARRLPLLRDRARKRGNLFALTAPSSMNLPAWAADQPEIAEQILDRCMKHWSGQRFYVQHFSALYDQIQTDLYRGDPKRAWKRIAHRQGAIAGSLLMRVQLSRAFTFQTRARCALSMAAQGHGSHRMLQLAERDALRVKREGQDWTLPLAELILAAVAAARRQVPQSIALLEKAVVHFDRVDMVLYAAVTRRQLGQLIGGSTGQELVAAAHRWMSGQNIVAPERFARLFAPGFPEGLHSTKRPP